jgi:hypothetical protein
MGVKRRNEEETDMRLFALLPLLMIAGCGVDTDPRNDRVTLEYNEQRVENALDAAANEAGRVASDVGNSIEGAGQRIENDIGDIDVDLDVRRNESGNKN